MSDLVTNLSIIAAVADNRVIGQQNQLPWHLPADLRRFRQLTMGKPILMGRKTWQSLPGLLPGRAHWVITRNTAYQAHGAHIVHSLIEAIQQNCHQAEIMLIGGADLFAQAMPLATRMYLTEVHQEPDGDAFFPSFEPTEWREMCRETGPDGAYDFVAWHRY